MTLALNEPAIRAELLAASDAYEHALATNDVTTLDALFHDGPEVVRYGAQECLYGADEIAAYRRARSGGAPPRAMTRREIVAIGTDLGCVNLEFRLRANGRQGRQSQTWVRTAQGFRVMSAHVSLLP